jgi:hypothetical protein
VPCIAPCVAHPAVDPARIDPARIDPTRIDPTCIDAACVEHAGVTAAIALLSTDDPRSIEEATREHRASEAGQE